MPRYKLTIEYDGGPFVGWQRQENGRSVQQAIEEAVPAFSGETIGLKGGRRPHSGLPAPWRAAASVGLPGRGTLPPCTPRRRRSSATTTSPPSVRPNASRSRR